MCARARAHANNIYLFTYLLIYLFTYLLIYLFTYLLIYLFTYLLIYLFTYLLIYLFTYLLIYLFTYLLIYLFTYLLIYLLVYLSIYLFIDLVDFNREVAESTTSEDFVVVSNYFDLSVPIDDIHLLEHRNCKCHNNCTPGKRISLFVMMAYFCYNRYKL